MNWTQRLAPSVSSNVTRLRTERGWTQRHLSALSGVHYNTINHIERNSHGTTLETLSDLAQAFGVPLSALLELNDAAPPLSRRAPRVFVQYRQTPVDARPAAE